MSDDLRDELDGIRKLIEASPAADPTFRISGEAVAHGDLSDEDLDRIFAAIFADDDGVPGPTRGYDNATLRRVHAGAPGTFVVANSCPPWIVAAITSR